MVSEAALPFERVVSRCKPWFGSGEDNEGWKILELDIQQAVRERAAADDALDNNGSGKDSLVTEDGEVLAYAILRGTLQRILQKQLLQEHGVEVQLGKKLCGISYTDSVSNILDTDDEGIVCQFMDGSKTGPYDLVVGSDGIQSAVKKFVDTGKTGLGLTFEQKSNAIYSGLRITFAIQDESEEDIPTACFRQYFGNGAYALTSSYGCGKGNGAAKGAFLVYGDPNYIGPFPKPKSNDVALDENADWSQDNRVTRDHVTECLEVLQSASIPGNDVENIVQKADRFFDLGVYLHNPFSLSGWVREVPRATEGGRGLFGGSGGRKTSKYAITTGDAAHAMPPFLGQGANQALQDSCSLAVKIREFNTRVQQPLANNDDVPDLKASLKEYENRRWLPTTSITAKAALLGYLEVGTSLLANFRDAFFFTMGKIGIAKKIFIDAATPKL